MRFNVIINQDRCLKNGLNVNQSALMSLLNELPSWANEKLLSGKTYWHISRNKVINELPLFYDKPDTVYRHFRVLDDLKLIEYVVDKKQDYVRLTVKGKMWNKLGNESEFESNSEINPRKLGNKSEFLETPLHAVNLDVTLSNSEINPTYNIYNNNTSNDIEKAIDFLAHYSPELWESFQMRFRSKFTELEWIKFVEVFNCRAYEEKLRMHGRTIDARLRRFTLNYLDNMKASPKAESESVMKLPSSKKIA